MALQVNSNYNNSNGRGAFNNKGKGWSSSKGGNCLCTHCGKTNLIVENCFDKIGFPPDYKINKTKNSFQANNTPTASVLESPQQGPSAQSYFHFTQEMYQGILEALQQSKFRAQPQANSITGNHHSFCFTFPFLYPNWRDAQFHPSPFERSFSAVSPICSQVGDCMDTN
ncbi:hypothetical protein TSUD_400500 [Trifolium subterraneum]|uniref:Uncharacterized protein n=1 Tax=Trifolium subterraneum TaxID=3900 RepID=A0A2Z6PJF5_TRISU|nr:hypothetical protein TSUD_400500 [Trifolium subterraneum]